MTRPPERGSARPRVSVVTPSLNQGRFLREALDSVLTQGYPHLEILVMDAGSTDETLDILRSYGDRIAWVSEPDDGQSDAIAKGFRRTHGEILAWLNADDVLMPGAVERAVKELEHSPDLGLVYGRGVILDEWSRETGPFVGIEPFNLWRLLHTLDYVLQPATFFRRSAYEAAGGLNPKLYWAMDWDLWIRLAGVAEVRFVDQVLAGSREWQETKTATGGWRRIGELKRLVKWHTGRGWSPGVRLYALETLRQQLRGAVPGLVRTVDSAVAFVSRRILEGVPVYSDGWLGPQASLVVPRRWGGFEAELEAHQLPPAGRFEVRFSVGRKTLGNWTVDAVGRRQLSFRLPEPTGEPFVEVCVDSGYAFSTAEDRRKLSVRCLGLSPAEE